MTFDERLRLRAKRQGCPVPEGFDARLETLLENLPEQRKGRRPLGRSFLIAAALCAALAVTVFAASPGLREALDQFLGSSLPYTQEIESTTRDKGIEMKVVRALVDDYQAKVYVEVRDLTDGRLTSGNVELEASIRRKALGESSVASGGCRLVSYDDAADTALFEVTYESTVPAEEEMVFLARGLRPELYRFPNAGDGGTPLPAERVTGETLKSRSLDDGTLVLEPGQTVAELPGAMGISLSSMGFASDGYLHFLFRLPEGAQPEETHLLTTVRSKAAHAAGEINGDTVYNTAFTGGIGFLADGVPYYDFGIQGATPADLSDLSLDPVGGILVLADRIQGSWEISFAVEKVPSRAVALSDTLDRPGMKLKSVTLSAISVWVEGDTTYEGRATLSGQRMTLFLADGAAVPLGESLDGSMWEYTGGDSGHFITGWDCAQSIDPDQVAGVAIGLRYLPLDGSPGSWLSELPE